MTEKSSAVLSEADRNQVASAMMNGVTLHARDHGGDTPLAAYLQRAIELMPPDLAEQYASLYRSRLVKAVVEREPDPTLIEKVRRWIGRDSSTPENDREREWIETKGNPKSPTMRAFLADLLLMKGDREGAEREYTAALHLVREQGIVFEE